MMTCSICRSRNRRKVDAALVSGASTRSIATRYAFSASSVLRHKNACVQQRLAKVERAESRSLHEQIAQIMARLEDVSRRAEKGKRWPSVIAALRELRSCVELLAEADGSLRRYGSRVAVGVQVSTDSIVKEFLALSDAERCVELASMIANALNNNAAVAEEVGTILNKRKELRESLKSGEPLTITANAATDAGSGVLSEASQNRDGAESDSQKGSD